MIAYNFERKKVEYAHYTDAKEYLWLLMHNPCLKKDEVLIQIFKHECVSDYKCGIKHVKSKLTLKMGNF